MCGIAGKINFNGEPVPPALLKAMCDVIRHRGPDDEGFYNQSGVGLGMRRLSIIDVAGGQQPVHNEDKTVWVVFNGEIYNHLELREELRKKGHRFESRVDTEVIVHLYEEYGEEFASRLNGMFGIALWDMRRNSLVLVRDRIGIKPLSYCQIGSTFLFGSEIKSILVDPLVPRDLDLQGLDTYFTFGYIPAPFSIFKKIRKLQPGHLLIAKGGNVQVRQYWDVQPTKSGKIESEEYYRERILSLLKKSVQRRLMSDVPLGAFLSGGVDSSAVVGLMSQEMDQPVKTFSIGFEEDDYSELPDARRVANHFGTEHTELIVRPDALDLLPKLAAGYDEPFADSSAIPTYYVSQLARQHVTVALSGDGGDELFGGYSRYVDDRRDAIFSKLPLSFRCNVLGMIGKRMPENTRFKKYLQYIAKSDEHRYFQRVGLFDGQWRRGLYNHDFRVQLNGGDSQAWALDYVNRLSGASHVERFLYLDLKTYLPFDILTKVDVASMMNSLEVRVPLLDHEFVEFTATIPVEMKIVGRQQKHIFKNALAAIIPSHVFEKRKQGFATPLKHWFRTELREFTQDTFASVAFKQRGLISTEFISDIFSRHLQRRDDYSELIWSVLVFEMWCQKILDCESEYRYAA